MRLAGVILAIASATSAAAATPDQPLSSGRYTFQHRFFEHPEMPSIKLTAIINGRRIQLINDSSSDVFPVGVIERGKLMWHAKSGQWIVGQRRSDRTAEEVGGCSDGPPVIDLQQRIFWTC